MKGELKDYEKEQQDNSKSTGNGFGTYVTDVRIRDESAEYNSAAGIEESGDVTKLNMHMRMLMEIMCWS